MHIEHFEPRRMLAAHLDQGRLLIEGSETNDRITLAQHPQYLNVLVVDVTGNAGYFSIGAITSIDIRSGAGNDIVRIDSSLNGLGIGASIRGGAGADRLYGGDANDTLLGEAGPDRLYGGGGDDLLLGGDEGDYLAGGAGKDVLLGDSGNDLLVGDAGADTLNGGIGNDALFGGTDSDALYGGAGDDNLYGSDIRLAGTYINESDKAHGESGADWFDGGTQWASIDFNKNEDRKRQNVLKQDPKAQAGYGGYVADMNMITTVIGKTVLRTEVPSLLALQGIGYLYDGLAAPSDSAGFLSRSSQTFETPTTLELSMSQRKQMVQTAVSIPKGWQLSAMTERQGMVVWYRLRSAAGDRVDYTHDDQYSASAFRFLAIRRGTVILPASTKDLVEAIKPDTARVRVAAGAAVHVAGDPTPHTMRGTFDSAPKLRRGTTAILLDDGYIKLAATGAAEFVPFA